MLICPECEEEFPDSITTCWDCNVELVSSLDTREENFPELVVVCTILNEATAYIIRGFLESEGVPCQLEHISFHAQPAPVADLMRVRLWIKKEDTERAKKLLAEREDIQVCSACETEVDFQDEVCGHCGESLSG